MRKFLVWSALAIVIALLASMGGYWAYWNFYARFQPTLITRNQAEIQRLLDEASWVSAGGGGEPLYLVGWRDCDSCQTYQREEFPLLRAAGVEPRVVMIARPDREGLAQSTAAERATVAELWLTRDWTLYQRWSATPPRNWTAAGIPPADGNLARTAVVGAGRDFQQRLETLLRASGVRSISYPLILWRDQDGYLKVCACSDSRSYAFIRDDVGAEDSLPAPPQGTVETPGAPLTPLPYPDVSGEGPEDFPAIPPVPGQDGPSSPANPPREPREPAAPRDPPQASRQEDSVFY
ncbi:hypothetical protein [Brevundimonas sp.]|uniref:hypothetical protein n=1 Tax=Brevundimonas sp. TaxID=1871086 RepID=UPI0025EAD5F0|nr:hypothetical protein [Brevundimonas sp.]